MKIVIYKKLIKYLKSIIENTAFAGHVYAVGGCVRDFKIAVKEKLEGNIKDVDLVVDLPNGGIEFAKFLESSGYTKGSLVIYETFGTVMFRLKKFPDIELEAVQTRSECYRDENSRNPETSYGTIQQDAFRRDFTINALYHDITNLKEIDFNGHGLEDLENHIIDTCGEPDIIFDEDPLRIMRAVRFAARLGYTISDRTVEGIKKHAKRLSIISQERITDEFNKILETSRPQYGISKLIDYGIIDVILPEIKNILDNDLLIKIGKLSYDLDCYNAMARDKNIPEYSKKLNILILIAYRLPIIFADIMKRMKYSNDEIKEVRFYAIILYSFQYMLESQNMALLRNIEYQCKTMESYKRLYFIYKEMGHIGWEPAFIGSEHPMLGYKLPIDGDYLMCTFGLTPGKEVGIVLRECLNAAFANPKLDKNDFSKSIWKYMTEGGDLKKFTMDAIRQF